MTFLISFFNKALIVLAAIWLTSCAAQFADRHEAPLVIKDFFSDREGPLTAKASSVLWTVVVSGEAGPVTLEFRTLKDGIERVEQSGDSLLWDWRPNKPGLYRIKVIAEDSRGKRADSGWSEEYFINLAFSHNTVIALLPVDNLSGTKVPGKQIQNIIAEALTKRGYSLLAPDTLGHFMHDHRMRYSGGIDSNIGIALQKETGSNAFFITSVETFQESKPPKISLVSRVVLAGETPEILWMDGVGLTGDDAPGLLGLGRVDDSSLLLEKAVGILISSFNNFMENRQTDFGKSSKEMQVSQRERDAGFFSASFSFLGERRLRPRLLYRSPVFDSDKNYSVAVVPFLNRHSRKNAGMVVSLHFVNQLLRYEDFRVIEPGLVRETLLKYRMIMPSGPSLAISDAISSDSLLGADLILSGEVFDYQDQAGVAKADFSVQVIDAKKREIIWSSRSYAAGDDYVYFFDFGMIPSAHVLTSRMTKAVVDKLEE